MILKRLQELPAKKKLIYGLSFVVILIQACTAWVNFRTYRNHLRIRMDENTQKQISLIIQLAQAKIIEFDVPSLESMIDDISKNPNVEFAGFFDLNGKPITHLLERPDHFSKYSKTYVQPVLSESKNGKAIGSFELTLSTKEIILEERKALYSSLTQTMTLVVALILMIQYFFFRIIYHPLRLLSEGTRRATEGDLTFQLPVIHKDEFGELSVNFNKMVRKIRNQQETLENTVSQRTRELEETNTQLIRKIKEVEATRMQLMETQKFSALGNMAGGIAHEINTPLNIITLNSSVIQEELDRASFDKDLTMDSAKKIEFTSLRIAKIIQALRTFSHEGREESKVKIGLESIISDTLDLCTEKFKFQGVSLQVSTVPNLQINCRPNEMIQVLFSLLQNSLDAVSGLQDAWTHLEFILNEESQGSKELQIHVTDSGTGIPEDIRSRIFEPFFTTKAVGTGTGLGLSVSRQLIESHDGKLEYDKKSPNTRFVIRLPIS